MGRSRRRFDFVETSPRSLENLDFFFKNLTIFRFGLAVNVLTRPHVKKYFFQKRYI